MPQHLPNGYSVRPASPHDARSYVALLAAIDAAEGAHPWASEDDYLEDQKRPHFDPGSDSWIVEADGAVVAYADAWDQSGAGDVEATTFIHPAHRREPLERFLLERLEERAREMAGPDGATVRNYTSATDTKARLVLERSGYTLVRHFWHMDIDLAPAYEAPPPPDGATVRAWTGEPEARRFNDVIQTAFTGHWNFTPISYEDWWPMVSQRSDFDPSLSFVVLVDGSIVAASRNQITNGRPWVVVLGVLPELRGRGFGRILLQRSFEEFARRGYEKATLNVDAANETGATRLYESVGMYVTREFVAYEKRLAAHASVAR